MGASKPGGLAAGGESLLAGGSGASEPGGFTGPRKSLLILHWVRQAFQKKGECDVPEMW